MRKTPFIFYFILFSYSLHLTGQELSWLNQSNSANDNSNLQFFSSTEYDGDFYFVGDFWKDLILDDFNIAINEGASADSFIFRMDETGKAKALWHFKSDNYVRITKIVANPITETLIVTGYYREDLTYNGQEWTTPNFSNGFVMSIHKDGTLDWMKEIQTQNGNSNANGQGLVTDDSGNIFVAIEARGMIKIDNQSFDLKNQGTGVIMAKLDSNGKLLDAKIWTNQFVEGWMDITSMDINEENEIVIGGSIIGNMDIDNTTYYFPETSHQSFILQLNNTLNVQWLKSYPSTNNQVRAICIDGEDMIISMQYRGILDVDGNSLQGSSSWGDMAIISLDKNVDVKWVKNFTLSEAATNAGVYGTTMTTWNNQYYIGGMYQGDVLHEGDLVLDNTPSSSSSYQYPFILSLSKDGELTNIYDFVGSSSSGSLHTLTSNAAHLVFGGDFFRRISMENSTLNTGGGSAFFYGALSNDITEIEESINEGLSFSVYPTIASNEIQINIDSEVENFILLNASGQIINKFSGQTKQINTAQLAAGIYYLCAKLNNKSSYAKFIKP